MTKTYALSVFRFGLMVLAFVVASAGVPAESRAGVHVGIGGYTEMMDSLQNTTKAGKNGVFDPGPAFSFGYDVSLGGQDSSPWTYNPELIIAQLFREADHDTYLITLN